MELPGVALITGAGSGIGAATALAFVQAGCRRLTLADLNSSGLEKTREDIKRHLQSEEAEIVLATGDTTDSVFVDKLVTGIVERFGELNYAVNCAGRLGPWARPTDADLGDHDLTMNVNYRGTYLCNTAEIRAMMKNKATGPEDIPGQRGAIVNIASTLGFNPIPNAPAYCASKGAVIALTRANAADYSPEGIRVNCIAPGLVDTPLATRNGDPDAIKGYEPIINMVPMKRWGRPREVADAAVFLCSGRASFVQGHVLVVDGGFTIS